MDSTKSRDALLALLYSPVDFLENQIEEKDLLIRTLFIKENYIYNYDTCLSNEVISYCAEPLKDCEISEVTEISYCKEILKDSEGNFVNSEESEEVITKWES